MTAPAAADAPVTGPSGSAIYRNLLVYAALMLPVLGLLVAFHPDRIGLAMALCAAGTMLAAFAGWPLWLAEPQPRSFPVLAIAGSFYGITFGLSPFLVDLGWIWYQPIWNYNLVILVRDPQFQPMLSAFAGIALFMAAWIGLRPVFLARLPGLRLPALGAGEVRICLWALSVAYLAWRLLPQIGSLPSVDQFFQPAGLILVAGWFLCWRRGLLSRVEMAVILLLLLPLELAFRARDFLITDIMILAILIGMLMLQARMRKTLIFLGISGLMVLSAYDVISGYRAQFHAGQKDFHSLWQVYREAWTGKGGRYMTFHADGKVSPPPPVGALVRRFSLVWLYQRVAEDTPATVPYWMGESYRPLAGAAIPRFLWPDKPIEDTGFRFGERYGFLKQADHRTSLNVPWIVELRANFGLAGVLGGMALFGLLMALLDRVLNRPGAGVPEAAVGIGLIVPLVYPESNFSVMTGSLPLALVAFAVWFSLPLAWRKIRGV